MTFLDVLKPRTANLGTLSKDGRMLAYMVSTPDWKEPDQAGANGRKRLEAHFDVGIVNPVPVPDHLREITVDSKKSRHLASGNDFSAGQLPRDETIKDERKTT